MKVASLTLTNFYKWRKTPMVMGEGLTFVVGKNGTGKSSLGVEAVSWIIWKKLIRGGKDKGFVADGTFTLDSGKYRIARGKDLLFERVGDGGALVDLAGQTPSQTQDKIQAVFGSWETFVATHVFSGQRAKTFGGSTNASRQEILLDLMPELSKFDAASAMARTHVKEAEEALQTIHVASERAQAVLAEVKEQLEGAYTNKSNVTECATALAQAKKDAADRETEAKDLDAKEQKLRKIHDEASQDAATMRVKVGESTTVLRQVQDDKQRMRGLAAECPSCYQKVPGEHRADIIRSLTGVVQGAVDHVAHIQDQYDMLASEVSDANGAVAAVMGKARGARNRQMEAVQWVGTMAREATEAEQNQREVERLQGRLSELQSDANTKSDQEGDVTESLIRARAVAEVLGPRGVRVGLMDDQLQFLAAAACEVLTSLGSTISVQLSTTKPTAKGGEGAPQVHVKVTVEGEAHDYAELSAGERVRLDVSFLLALAKMGTAGFLTFDEVFDPLDEEGLEGVANLLQDMARDRQIIVVSHNPRLASLMPRGAVWRVERESGGPSVLRVG